MHVYAVVSSVFRALTRKGSRTMDALKLLKEEANRKRKALQEEREVVASRVSEWWRLGLPLGRRKHTATPQIQYNACTLYLQCLRVRLNAHHK